MAERRSYTPEFKKEAVRLVTEQQMPTKKVARDLGIQPSCLRAWIKRFTTDAERAFPGKGHPQDAELYRLRRELAQVKMERDILKKAVGIFSQMPRL